MRMSTSGTLLQLMYLTAFSLTSAHRNGDGTAPYGETHPASNAAASGNSADRVTLRPQPCIGTSFVPPLPATARSQAPRGLGTARSEAKPRQEVLTIRQHR